MSVVEQHTGAHLLDAKDADGACGVAVLDTWVTWHEVSISHTTATRTVYP